MRKIMLNLDDFKCLVSGGILNVKNDNEVPIAQIALSDIGFDLMHDVIDNLQEGREKPYQDRIKQIRS